MKGERVRSLLQLLNVAALVLIGSAILWVQSHRPLSLLAPQGTLASFENRNLDAVDWRALQPLLDREKLNKRREFFTKGTRGLLAGEQHRAVAAGFCPEGGSVVSADKELGYTLEAFIPFAYFLHLHGCLKHTEGYHGSESFFIFNSEHRYFDPPIPADDARRWQFDNLQETNNPFKVVYNDFKTKNSTRHIHNPIRTPDYPVYGLAWPDYQGFYKSKAFANLSKPLAVVAGKYTSEWGSKAPSNYFATPDRLRPILDALLGNGYVIVYNRPNILYDSDTQNQKIQEPGDHELIRSEYANRDVIIMQDLEQSLIPETLKDYDLLTAKNSLLLQIYSSTQLFVVTQGGNAVLASLFPADSFLLHSAGSEMLQPNSAIPSEMDFVYDRWGRHGRSRTFPNIYFEDFIRNLEAYLGERRALAKMPS